MVVASFLVTLRTVTPLVQILNFLIFTVDFCMQIRYSVFNTYNSKSDESFARLSTGILIQYRIKNDSVFPFFSVVKLCCFDIY
jgi:hypothetical protein